jgi:hypothetical protein
LEVALSTGEATTDIARKAAAIEIGVGGMIDEVIATFQKTE